MNAELMVFINLWFGELPIDRSMHKGSVSMHYIRVCEYKIAILVLKYILDVA